MAVGNPITDEFTADQAVGTSGKRTVVYSVTLTAGADAAVLVLRNGTSAAGTAKKTIKAAIQATTHVLLKAALFPDGCFADFTAGTAPLASVEYDQTQ
jgi:hypothetical protein